MAEQEYAADLKSAAARHVGSIPTLGTQWTTKIIMSKKKQKKKNSPPQRSSTSKKVRSRSSSPKEPPVGSVGVKKKKKKSNSAGKRAKSPSQGRNHRPGEENREIVMLSRYGVPRIIRFISSNRATITGDSRFMRFSTNYETGIVDMADFEGGPDVSVGCRLPGAGVVRAVEKWEYVETEKTKVDSVTVTFTHDATG